MGTRLIWTSLLLTVRFVPEERKSVHFFEIKTNFSMGVWGHQVNGNTYYAPSVSVSMARGLTVQLRRCMVFLRQLLKTSQIILTY